MNKTPPESAKKTLSHPIKVEANFNLEGFAEDIDR
jgi:hypothetical protein